MPVDIRDMIRTIELMCEATFLTLGKGKTMLSLIKIISGGQAGADQGALRAGRLLGLLTGGYAPPGWRTVEGPAPWLGAEFGLIEMTETTYKARTYANVHYSDATVRFDFNTPGECCTLNAIQHCGKRHLDVDVNNPVPHADFVAWLCNYGIRTLNVAGNAGFWRDDERLDGFVCQYLYEALKDHVKSQK